MKFSPIPCHESLQPFIRNYWLLDSYCTARGTQKIFSNGAASLHFYLSKAVKLDNEEREYSTALNHLDTGFMEIHSDEGPFVVFGVEFTPFCSRMFFPKTTALPHFTPEDASEEEYTQMSNDIHAAQSTEERVAILNDFFCKRLSQIPSDDINLTRMNDVFQQIVPTDGSVVSPPKGQDEFSPTDLASTACLSQKQFTRVFNKYVGMNPKTYLRLIRFHKALMELQHATADPSKSGTSMTDVAWKCGYYDLAHMISDFRSLCGYSPSEMLAAGGELTEAFSPQFSGLMKKKIKMENLI